MAGLLLLLLLLLQQFMQQLGKQRHAENDSTKACM
jgi:hypothetical protein